MMVVKIGSVQLLQASGVTNVDFGIGFGGIDEEGLIVPE